MPRNEGWICPRCGKVNAPFMLHCDCKPEEQRSNLDKKPDVKDNNIYHAPGYLNPLEIEAPSYVEVKKSGPFKSDPCASCKNHPKNGGTGICNCIYAAPPITCDVSSRVDGMGMSTIRSSAEDSIEKLARTAGEYRGEPRYL